ncbi:zinc finger CCCH domain-containing protein 14-like [Lolium rigidum]|uniref:zinc finger CCCH domain-containing protein 14-like n=1 Tax=Lolium rigidum TaxID=89674 RepID=UPI001F5DD291|nr:zinc finger CCCH domain-containing protein 14-like [Lolium rigidum]
MEGGGRKRGTADGANGAFVCGKRTRESESFQTGVGSKLKPCIKFFSTAGCPFGEGCHFLHCFPDGHQAVAKMSNLGGPAFADPPRRMTVGPAVPNGALTLTFKTRLCNKYDTSDGCKWGDKCHFAHGEGELGKHMFMNNSMPPHVGPKPTSHSAPPAMLTPGMTTPASFGASATAKISVDAPLVGAIIGKGGINTKYISRVSGAKLVIRDHESDASLRNIELEGTFDQINDASAMVTELIVSIDGNSSAPPPGLNLVGGSHRSGGPGSNFKTKLCEHFTKGPCTFGDRCHFAHGENELRKSASA